LRSRVFAVAVGSAAFWTVYSTLASSVPSGTPARARADARFVASVPGWRFERFCLGLVPSHSAVAALLGGWYLWAHLLGTALAVLALFAAASSREYTSRCLALLGLSSVALVVFLAFPVAPPAVFFRSAEWMPMAGQARELPYAAMPSLHVAWADWAGLSLSTLVSRRWLRSVLRFGYPLVTLLVVLLTGNHWLLDCVAGVALSALAESTRRRVVSRCLVPRSCSRRRSLSASPSRCSSVSSEIRSVSELLGEVKK
jgi:hypothetical protein